MTQQANVWKFVWQLFRGGEISMPECTKCGALVMHRGLEFPTCTACGNVDYGLPGDEVLEEIAAMPDPVERPGQGRRPSLGPRGPGSLPGVKRGKYKKRTGEDNDMAKTQDDAEQQDGSVAQKALREHLPAAMAKDRNARDHQLADLVLERVQAARDEIPRVRDHLILLEEVAKNGTELLRTLTKYTGVEYVDKSVDNSVEQPHVNVVEQITG